MEPMGQKQTGQEQTGQERPIQRDIPAGAGGGGFRFDKVLAVVRREYLARIKTKGFWISTVLVPLLFGSFMFLPILITSKTSTDHHTVLVDETGRIAAAVADALEGRSAEGAEDEGPVRNDEGGLVRFSVEVVEPAADTAAQRAELDERVLGEGLDSWVWISREGLAEDRVEYHGSSVSNFLTQEVLEETITREVRRLRLSEEGLDADRVAELTRPVDLETVRVTAEGGRAEEGFAGVILSYGLFFLLYMIILIWGQQVMLGVLEEKTSRAVEVLISSLRPAELMAGKLLGIGAAGLTQLTVWLVTLGTLTAPAVVSSLAFLPEDGGIPSLSLTVALNFIVCFLLGYFLFASIYAAIGSAFNNVQEAQQFAGTAVVLLIAPLLLFVPVINDPDGTLAVVSSMIPLFTPLLMLLRVAVKTPPLWQMLTAYAATGALTALVIWGAARIYRVGILMYGKKPTLGEILRWLRYA